MGVESSCIPVHEHRYVATGCDKRRKEGKRRRERKKEKRRVVWSTRVTHSFRNVTPLPTGGSATTPRGLKGGKKKCWRVVTL